MMLLLICAATPMRAMAQHDAPHGTVASASSAGESKPVAPADPRPWAGPMLIIIIGMFVAAAVIGPIVRAEAPPEEEHASHGHDDHAHDDHAHGHAGH
jgi:hypothetical protein